MEDFDRFQTISEEIGEHDSFDILFSNWNRDKSQLPKFRAGLEVANTTSVQDDAGPAGEREQNNHVDCKPERNQGFSRPQIVRVSLFSC